MMTALRTSDGLARLAKAATAAILLAVIGLTLWVWSLPHSVPAARAWGEHRAYAEAATQLRKEQQGLKTADLRRW